MSSVGSQKESKRVMKDKNEGKDGKDIKKKKDGFEIDFNTLAFKAGATTIFYPNQMAQALMQIGHEPFLPKNSETLLGRPCLLLTNNLDYIRYVYQVDGILGCFRGLGPRLAEQSIFYIVCSATKYQLQKHKIAYVAPKSGQDESKSLGFADYQVHDNEITLGDHFKSVTKDWCCRIVGITASYPLQVITLRTIAEFVGRENTYGGPGIMHSIVHIFRESGFAGFFSGLAPRLLGETINVFTIGLLGYFVKSQVSNDEGRSLLNLSMSVLVSSMTYPFTVVSNTMAVCGSGLQAGALPNMPQYESWLDCWHRLSRTNQLRRGSSIIFRYYTGPTTMVNGMRVPRGIHFGPNHLENPFRMMK